MWMRSIPVKVAILTVLIGILLVPLLSIWALTMERAGRRDEVRKEVSAIWGSPQQIAGPVLSVPYVMKDGEGHDRWRLARFLPATLSIHGRMDPEIRRRSIYDVPVFTARLSIAGAIARPDPASIGLPPEAMRWEGARISLGVPDLKGVLPEFSLRWNGQLVAVEPEDGSGLFGAALAGPSAGLRGMAPGTEVPFEIALPVRGSGSLTFLPAGRTTTVELASSWPSPGFVGAFLPEQRSIGDRGFTARWRAASFGRNVPQAWTDDQIERGQANERFDAAQFGVDLVTPVDIYQQAERSTKYGILFVLLTFAAFFLVEVLQDTSVHPVQYLLIGAALCVFYLLLLSLAEQIGFAAAYLVATLATVGLIGTYARHALRSRRSALRMVALLATLYAFLYGLLQLEDYALLLGSVALFAILAAAMFLTRRVDWYTVGTAPAGRAGA